MILSVPNFVYPANPVTPWALDTQQAVSGRAKEKAEPKIGSALEILRAYAALFLAGFFAVRL